MKCSGRKGSVAAGVTCHRRGTICTEHSLQKGREAQRARFFSAGEGQNKNKQWGVGRWSGGDTDPTATRAGDFKAIATIRSV